MINAIASTCNTPYLTCISSSDMITTAANTSKFSYHIYCFTCLPCSSRPASFSKVIGMLRHSIAVPGSCEKAVVVMVSSQIQAQADSPAENNL